MSRTMIQAVVTMNQLQNKLDIIGHNLANSETAGYKSRHVEFSSLLHQQIDHMNHPMEQGQRQTPEGIRIGSGAKLGAINMDLSVGSRTVTGRSLDTALIGEHYFYQVEVTEGGASEVHYTRDGAFYLNPLAGNNNLLMLTTKSGYPVLGTTGPIMIRDGFDHLHIAKNGQVITTNGSETNVEGQIAVVEARQPRLLEAVGQNNFKLPDLDLLNLNLGEVIQPVGITDEVLESGALENSNVNYAKQMTDLMMLQRAYQFNARTITMSDQMLGLISQLR